MSHCCSLRSILIFLLFACGVLSAPTENPSKGAINAGQCTTDTSQVDEENSSTTSEMIQNENKISTDTIAISNTQGISNNRNKLDNDEQSTQQLSTESSIVSSSTTDSTTKSTEVIQSKPTESSPTERTKDGAEESKESTIKATIKEEQKTKETGMPSGVIVLITAITFAIAIIIAYVGLIVWRRYLEYRYGNRELLVNDLEFDTNDLRHFEL